MSKRIAVVTGATSGIGAVVARELAASGMHVIACGRDGEKMRRLLSTIRAAAPDAAVDAVLGDLSVMADAARMAREIAALAARIDVMVLNAGGHLAERRTTADGYEATFAGNHIGHFLLGTRLLPLMPEQAGAKIIVTTSLAHKMLKAVDWDDLQSTRHYTASGAYGLAKLGNLLFVRELARRLEEKGIKAYAVHPGWIASNFFASTPPAMRLILRLMGPFMGTPEKGADTIVWIAKGGADGAPSGGYWNSRHIIPSSPLSQDPDVARRMWIETENLIAQTGA